VSDTDLYRLLGGPYTPPALHVGDRTRCLYRKAEVVITSWSHARIRWPQCRVGGSGRSVSSITMFGSWRAVPRPMESEPMAKRRADFGKRLNTVYQTGAAHALFREDGSFYMQLERFPGVLFDKSGFVLFHTERDLDDAVAAGHLRLSGPAEADGKMRINVPDGISAMPGYILYADHLVAQRSGLSRENVEIVQLLLNKHFARHRIAALFDVDQRIINDIAAGREPTRRGGAG
jgi:hypothetical protein